MIGKPHLHLLLLMLELLNLLLLRLLLKLLLVHKIGAFALTFIDLFVLPHDPICVIQVPIHDLVGMLALLI
jgi:hypothetical protein